ncbi:transcriptional regulator [Rummeliibacillus stabekisii]|uniref:Transcriptional regulator n=2 Tax=Rummeliibacillus stabekisii TaxID=241244 RepID=A0A143HH69_9BACL|nr:transcriptional regulator [Rummeliibacillus stabekisii]
MADLLGIDARTYINKENGLSQFKMNEMFMICKTFKRSLDEIFLPQNFMNHEVEEGGNATTSEG